MRIFSKISLIISFLIVFANNDVCAQFIDEASSPLDVGITYYKLAREIPDFESWASHTQEYGTALEESKAEVLEEETQRLQRAFAEYDHTISPINIRTLVDVSVKEGEKPKLSITFPNKKNSYFPYTYAGEDYALIAENSDVLADIPIEVFEVEQIKEKIPNDGKIFLILNTVAYKVNTKEQLKDNNLKFRPLLAKIGGISLYNSELESVWSWKAGWYSRVRRSLVSKEQENAVQN